MTVECYGCHSSIEVDDTPKHIYLGPGKGWQNCSPKPEAVWCCEGCRRDPVIFKEIRKAFMKRVGYIMPREEFDG